jgi:hypothetical protein
LKQPERKEEGRRVGDVQDAGELLRIFDTAFVDEFLGHAVLLAG